MKQFFAISTLMLFLSSASYAAEVCDPAVNEECICGKVPVMSKDGQRILYYNFVDGCVVPPSGGSSQTFKAVTHKYDSSDTNGGGSNSNDGNSSDSNDSNSNDSNEDNSSEDNNDD